MPWLSPQLVARLVGLRFRARWGHGLPHGEHAVHGLELRDPTSVQAKTAGHNRDSFPKWSIIDFEFPANDKRPAVKMTWYDGGQKPPAELFGREPVPTIGVLMIGDKGKLLAKGDYCEFGYVLIEGTDVKLEYPKVTNHFVEFANAIKGGPAATSNFPRLCRPADRNDPAGEPGSVGGSGSGNARQEGRMGR